MEYPKEGMEQILNRFYANSFAMQKSSLDSITH